MTRCPQCGVENPDDSYFCGSCGQQLRSAMERQTGPVSVSGELDTAPPAPPPVTVAAMPAAPPDNAVAESSPNRLNIAPPPGGPISADELRAGHSDSQGVSWGDPGPAQGYGAAEPSRPAMPGPGEQAPYVPPTGYAPPPSQVAPAPPGYNPYAQFQPADGNTSGMGSGYQAPPQTTGWTFAGFVPWGLFSFFNGNTTWGAIGLGLQFVGLGIGYAIYMGIKGREMAWQDRRFESLEQYEAVMKAWNTAGMIVLGVGVAFFLLYFLFVFGMIFAGMSGALD